MKRILVRYKTRPDRTEENERLVERVFQELHRQAPDGIRYAAVKLSDGATFVHLVEIDTKEGFNPLAQLDAFKAFQRDIKDRCLEQPQASDASVVGDYRLFGS